MNEKLIQIIAQTLELDPEEITPETGSDNCEKWDSLAQVVMISRVADELGVDIPFDKMMEIRCAGDLQSAIEG